MSNFENDLMKFTKMVEMKRKTCTLKVKSNSMVGYLYFRNGELVEAETDTLKGEQAISNIMRWRDVENEIDNSCKYDEKTKGSSYSQLLLKNEKDIFSKDVVIHDEEAKKRKEGVTMGTVWDALVKLKGQQDETNIVQESEGVGTKVILSESPNSISDIKDNGGKMEDTKEDQVSLNSDNEVSRIDKLNKVLSDLKKISYDIEACAVASEDGLIMASNLSSGLDEANVAAMCAVMLSMGERTSSELQCGTAGQLFIKGGKGYVVAMRAGSNAVLLVTAQKDAKLGLIFLDLSRAAKKVEQILS